MSALRKPDPIPSLGWTVLEWGFAYLPSPADEREPLVLTDEQAQFVIDFYSLDAARREFAYRRAIIEMAKGWGKSPLAAFLCLAEFAGPVCLDGFDAAGEPVGVPWGYGRRPPPLVQIAAVSEDQTDNTYSALYAMVTARKGKVAENLGLDVGRSRLYHADGRPGELEPVTASAGSREGQRVTFGLLDETHLWLSRNGGTKLAATIRRNAAKMAGRTVETTNAPLLGERSVAEQSGNVASRSTGILWLHQAPRESPRPEWPDKKLLAALREAYAGAPWVNLRRLLADIRDPATDWDDALRFWFNLRVAGSGRAVDGAKWDALAAPGRGVPPSGTRIGIGFDGSITTDLTVMRACTVDGYGFTLGYWERPAGPDGAGWRVPRDEVHSTLTAAFDTFDVGLLLADPPKWGEEIIRWAETWPDRVQALDTNSARRFAPAVDRWRTAIAEGTYTHDGDPVTTDHVKAAHLKKVRVADPEDDNRTMYVITKGAELRPIDAAVADILAHEAAVSMPPAEEQPRAPELW